MPKEKPQLLIEKVDKALEKIPGTPQCASKTAEELSKFFSYVIRNIKERKRNKSEEEKRIRDFEKITNEINSRYELANFKELEEKAEIFKEAENRLTTMLGPRIKEEPMDVLYDLKGFAYGLKELGYEEASHEIEKLSILYEVLAFKYCREQASRILKDERAKTPKDISYEELMKRIREVETNIFTSKRRRKEIVDWINNYHHFLEST